MALLRPPEVSSSEDEFLADDGDFEFKELIAKRKQEQRYITPVLSESQRRQDRLRKFCIALTNGNLELVKNEIENGLSSNESLEDKWNPILIAASTGNFKLFKFLLEKGANIRISRDGVTLLMLACNCPQTTSPFEESVKIVEFLLKLGADPTVVNRKRMNALMFAANNGNLDAVELLVPVTDITAQDNQNWNAIFWAVNGGHLEVLKYLINKGVPIDKVDVRNNTPLDVARNNEHDAIVDFFCDDDEIEEVLDDHKFDFESIFLNLTPNERPQFFIDVGNILHGTRTENLIKLFSTKNVTLFDLLSIGDDELKELGVLMPFQRRRILTGIHRFHKQPFHPKSIPTIGKTELYSNVDIAGAILSAIKQVISMEASLLYVQKNMQQDLIANGEMSEVLKNLNGNVRQLKSVILKLQERCEIWDQKIKPDNILTSKSGKRWFPWGKSMVLGLGLIFIVYKIKKY